MHRPSTRLHPGRKRLLAVWGDTFVVYSVPSLAIKHRIPRPCHRTSAARPLTTVPISSSGAARSPRWQTTRSPSCSRACSPGGTRPTAGRSAPRHLYGPTVTACAARPTRRCSNPGGSTPSRRSSFSPAATSNCGTSTSTGSPHTSAARGRTTRARSASARRVPVGSAHTGGEHPSLGRRLSAPGGQADPVRRKSARVHPRPEADRHQIRERRRWCNSPDLGPGQRKQLAELNWPATLPAWGLQDTTLILLGGDEIRTLRLELGLWFETLSRFHPDLDALVGTGCRSPTC